MRNLTVNYGKRLGMEQVTKIKMRLSSSNLGSYLVPSSKQNSPKNSAKNLDDELLSQGGETAQKSKFKKPTASIASQSFDKAQGAS